MLTFRSLRKAADGLRWELMCAGSLAMLRKTFALVGRLLGLSIPSTETTTSRARDPKNSTDGNLLLRPRAEQSISDTDF
jgi:hypothetical protein